MLLVLQLLIASRLWLSDRLALPLPDDVMIRSGHIHLRPGAPPTLHDLENLKAIDT